MTDTLGSARYPDFQRFWGQMIADGNPHLDHPTRDLWFDTSKFHEPEPAKS